MIATTEKGRGDPGISEKEAAERRTPQKTADNPEGKKSVKKSEGGKGPSSQSSLTREKKELSRKGGGAPLLLRGKITEEPFVGRRKNSDFG